MVIMTKLVPKTIQNSGFTGEAWLYRSSLLNTFNINSRTATGKYLFTLHNRWLLRTPHAQLPAQPLMKHHIVWPSYLLAQRVSPTRTYTCLPRLHSFLWLHCSYKPPSSLYMHLHKPVFHHMLTHTPTEVLETTWSDAYHAMSMDHGSWIMDRKQFV